jgi:FixJ family two-component response regulator
MTGIELARELIAARKNVPVILCTGFSQTVSQEEAEDLGVRRFLFKPVAKREMAAAIRHVLDVKSRKSAGAAAGSKRETE